MGFYGQVINYLAKTFNSIKIGNKIIKAQTEEDSLELKGEAIDISSDGNVITFSAQELSNKIGSPAAEGQLSTGVYAYIDSVKDSFSGTLTYDESTGDLTFPEEFKVYSKTGGTK